MEERNFDQIFERANKALEEHSKKLTTKDRKKMKKGTFCGPGRSFPVNDCQHAATAKAYLNRSKFSQATKQKIAACINRKAKAMGCGGKKKAKADIEFVEWLPTYQELSSEEKRLYSSDIFASTKALVEESLKNPDMELDFTEFLDEMEE